MDDGAWMDAHWVPRGVKRPAWDEPNDQPLAKRFSLLDLDYHGYLSNRNPVPSRDLSPGMPTPSDDSMQLDDTKDKVYIYNLDAELAEVSSDDDEKLIFLPDIDQKLTRIPHTILQNPRPPRTSPGNEVVLYNIPTSLTVPKEQDSVRKAIIEARARAREKQAEQLIRSGFSASVPEEIITGGNGESGTEGGIDNITPHINGNGMVMTNGFSKGLPVSPQDLMESEEDPDAMEIG